jgi:hypothetical protein
MCVCVCASVSVCVLVQVVEADGLYASVKNTIARMDRRQVMMALLWVGIGLLILTAIILIIYFKFVPKNSSNST